ncbi:unnamed protein product [Chrysoparadoxa australica]
MIDKGLNLLIEIFPDYIKKNLQNYHNKENLVEIIIDLGRRPEIRLINKSQYLSNKLVSWQDLHHIIKRIGNFSDDNRAGIPGTLHRISCFRNRSGNIIGLTCRVGRSITGTVSVIRDLIESKKSILILGRPGVGKTTLIREMSRVLADELEKRVIIVDTSNEIAGDNDIPHMGIGRARRLPVNKSTDQHNIMIQAVENHMPEIIIIDEIGTELEALAARTIAERGVQLIGTAHGSYLKNLIKNPILSELIGGVQYVILSDDEARRRGTQKSILERKSLSTFQIAIELHDNNNWIIHEKVEHSIDILLYGKQLDKQIRIPNNEGLISIKYEREKQFPTIASNSLDLSETNSFEKKKLNFLRNESILFEQSHSEKFKKLKKKTNLKIYLISISDIKIKKICNNLGLNINFTNEVNEVNFILTKNYESLEKKLKRLSIKKKIPIFILKNNSTKQLAKILMYLVELSAPKGHL